VSYLRSSSTCCARGTFGYSAVEHELSSGVVGLVEAAQQLLQGAVRIDVDAEHLAGNATVGPFNHAIGLRRPRLGVAILRLQVGARLGKGWREAAAVVGQRVGEAEGKNCRCLAQEGDGTLLSLVVLDREMDRAGAAIDGGVAEGSACAARGMATEGTNKKRLRRSPSAVCSFGNA